MSSTHENCIFFGKLLNMCPHTLNRYTKTFAKKFKFFSLSFSLVPFLFSFPENGTKTEPPENPENVLFLIERGFSSVCMSYISVLNSFYINSTTKQKVSFFGPYLVPFPENGTKKCLVRMKIAIFLWKIVEHVHIYPKSLYEDICLTIQVFFTMF